VSVAALAGAVAVGLAAAAIAFDQRARSQVSDLSQFCLEFVAPIAKLLSTVGTGRHWASSLTA
jgi:hypothetical protein